MKTRDFLKKHSACKDGAKWAWALSISKDMGDVWEAMIAEEKHTWLIWTATRPGVFSDAVLRKLACRFVRETPLADGRKIWDLLTDERSRKAVEVAEFYANGKATDGELQAARDAAYAVAFAAADAAARDAAYAAARAADAAARDAAYAADAAACAAFAAFAAARAAFAAACAAFAAFAAASDAADAAYDAAKAAQVRMIAELGNPFK